MSIWHSVGHVFASGYHDLIVAARAVASLNQKIQPEESSIEEVTSLIPVYGIEAETIERIAFACLGEFSALVQKSGGATQAATAIPQADAVLLQEVEAMMQKNPALVQKAATLFNVSTRPTK